jgi:hypothetical protein
MAKNGRTRRTSYPEADGKSILGKMTRILGGGDESHRFRKKAAQFPPLARPMPYCFLCCSSALQGVVYPPFAAGFLGLPEVII